MLLKSVKIENFRSLEDVRLDGFSDFNILLGRNNAGKSSVFAAVSYLTAHLFGRGTATAPNTAVLTNHDVRCQLGVSLTLDLDDDERAEFIHLLIESGVPEERRQDLICSPLLRQIAYDFQAPPGEPHNIKLSYVRILAEDGGWGTIYGFVPDAAGNIIERNVNLSGIGRSSLINRLSAGQIDVFRANSFVGDGAPPLATTSPIALRRKLATWVFGAIIDYVSTLFFFSPFRHAAETLPAEPRDKLDSDGSDLAVVLNYLSGADRPKLEEIERFVRQAIPEVGILHPGFVVLEGGASGVQQVTISFRIPSGASVLLRQMGGGVEELLMIATAIATEGRSATIFLEEPETHLHPGAQRFLADRIRATVKQVFVATHSPTFVNVPNPRTVYRVALTDGSTAVTRMHDPEGLSRALEDIGARNSDVLLSDAVLFVEGPTDRALFQAWSRALGMSLDEQNLTVLPMGGGAHAARHASIRSDILRGISNRAGIPHLIVLDRDERGQSEIASLERDLSETLHILAKREIENYLLAPAAILAAIKEKYRDDVTVRERAEAAGPEEVGEVIKIVANELFGIVLLKRIRAEVAGLQDGLLPTAEVSRLASHAEDDNLPELVRQSVEMTCAQRISTLDVPELVRSERDALEREWKDQSTHLALAPGEEILSRVFTRFGATFNKRTDAVRIVAAISKREVDPEVEGIIVRAVELAKSR